MRFAFQELRQALHEPVCGLRVGPALKILLEMPHKLYFSQYISQF
jgi:hypothetical protein